MRGVETDTDRDSEREGEALANGSTDKENMAPATGAARSDANGDVKHRAGRA